MKALSIIKYIFSFIGLAMLLGSFFIYQSTQSFIESASVTSGTVVRLVASRSSDDSVTYSPVVRFKTQKGESIEFRSSTSSNPPAYMEGENVKIYYLEANPQDAKIDGFFSLWGGSVIVGALGGIFFLIGFSILLVSMLKGRKEKYLKKHGVKIETKYQSVELNKSFTVNGRNPFQILSQWQNPATSEIHIFTSNNLWFDPTNHIKDENITVFIENNNPKKYFVDLSFLPKVAS